MEDSFSNPVAGIVANTPKDFQIYYNIVSLTSDLLSGLRQESDGLDSPEEVWSVVRLVSYVIPRASAEPLVASHYSMIDSLLLYLHSVRYFEDKEVCWLRVMLNVLKLLIIRNYS